jgi:hypothetical protein
VSTGGKLRALVEVELRRLMTIQASDRVWQMPFAAALASGLPLLIGAYFNHLDYGLVSSLGGLVFLYLPSTPLYHRMISVMACAFGMAACYTLGDEPLCASADGAGAHLYRHPGDDGLPLLRHRAAEAACFSSWRRRSARIPLSRYCSCR